MNSSDIDIDVHNIYPLDLSSLVCLQAAVHFLPSNTCFQHKGIQMFSLFTLYKWIGNKQCNKKLNIQIVIERDQWKKEQQQQQQTTTRIIITKQ